MLRVLMNDEGARALVRDALRRGRDLRPVLEDFAEHMVNSVQRNFEQGGRPEKWKPSKAEKTLTRTARLKNSIWQRVARAAMTIGTNVRYARIHHEGGVIEPKNAKALAIPLQDWIKGGPRRYKNLVYLPPKKGDSSSRGVLGRSQKTGTGKNRKEEFQPMFALRAKVKIPSRPYLLFQDEDHKYVESTLKSFLTTGRLS